ncbi:protease SohB [Kineosporia mesophila]|uniref:Protease SohB n=1 Tax=Kineosporia mesophila TaxID=566012 RepID=A0ABP7AHH7_9ACTN|nr:protease SohB [Kineosporia mesophila]MCD5350805.1 protease SohB [Kineosporia mesophila]
MRHALTDYLLFLAEGVTVVALLGALVVGVARLAAPRKPQSRLRVKNIGDHYDHLRDKLAEAVLPKRALRERRRVQKSQRKLAARGKIPARPRVFVLDFHGDLRASRVSGLREEITAVLSLATPADEVVLRLTNPGGTVNDQGLAASQLQRVRHRDIPLTVCVDTVAASGGYMMACVADRIVAAPFAIIGSIGVVSQIPNFHRLLDRLGVEVEQFTGGEFKRTVTMFGRNTDEDRAKVTEQVNEIHDLFKTFVVEQRPGIELERVATGEYWYGSDALELNLVDELRTSDDYLLAARERADLFEVTCPVPLSRVRRLTESGQAALARLR